MLKFNRGFAMLSKLSHCLIGLKKFFSEDRIISLDDYINELGLSLEGLGYQLEKQGSKYLVSGNSSNCQLYLSDCCIVVDNCKDPLFLFIKDYFNNYFIEVIRT